MKIRLPWRLIASEGNFNKRSIIRYIISGLDVAYVARKLTMQNVTSVRDLLGQIIAMQYYEELKAQRRLRYSEQ